MFFRMMLLRIVSHSQWSLVFLVLLMVLFVGSSLTLSAAHADGKTSAPPAMPVKVLAVTLSNQAIFNTYPARVQALKQVDVVARVGGILQTKYYQDGDEVKAGQPLYKIDDRKYQALVNKAKAQLQVEQASVNQAQREHTRVVGLFKNKAVSAQELDKTLANLELAKAMLAGAKANLNDAQIDLDYTLVKAEISGVIGAKQRDIGALVGTTAINSVLNQITQLDKVHVVYALPDSDLMQQRRLLAQGKLSLSTPPAQAQIINANQQVIAQGTVDFTASVVDAATGSVQGRALFDNANKALMPGEFVKLRVYGTVRNGVFVVPQKALVQMGQQSFVYVVKEQKAQLVPVQLAGQLEQDWLIEAGLVEGDLVIVENLIKLRPNMAVTPLADVTTPAAP
ncbi:efflux RND transporter periplasmic adaptor subunit [Thiomicrorhabdus aquaedulcis]|uniref:efflux RND transporter periplasmic adaptor subunit n=1 Tax=Thiomicrorhabdus aquaedulcis TaxID=2211106 RepID=UPI000FD7E460|nr:efflux RND transporter periplasmic adaptor subunit [Thiomicrorhabdus aquaedulcis]